MKTPKKPKVVRRYKNLSGASTVASYQLHQGGMTVTFTDNSSYRYTDQSATPASIEKMKKLAEAGKGLGTFIKNEVKDRFERKVR